MLLIRKMLNISIFTSGLRRLDLIEVCYVWNGAKFKLRYGDFTNNAHKLGANNIAGDSSYINHLFSVHRQTKCYMLLKQQMNLYNYRVQGSAGSAVACQNKCALIKGRLFSALLTQGRM